jgi:hypothetical protein
MWALRARDPVFLPEHLAVLQRVLPTVGRAEWSVSASSELVMVRRDADGEISEMSSFPATTLSPGRDTDLARYALFAGGWVRAMEAGGCWVLMRLLDVPSLASEDAFFEALRSSERRRGVVHRAWADTIARECGAACLDEEGARVLGAFADGWDDPKQAHRTLSQAYRSAHARRALGPSAEHLALAHLLLPLAESMMQERTHGARAFVTLDGVEQDSELLLVRTACAFLEVALGGDDARLRALRALLSEHA